MFEIFYHDMAVGTADVKTIGLYYHIVCHCIPPDDSIYRICVHDGLHTRSLGICVPEGKIFSLTARIPVKYLKEEMSFRLIPNKPEYEKLSVATDEPFEALHQLETARFQTENGQPQILIDPIPIQQDSGLNQEYENKSLLL